MQQTLDSLTENVKKILKLHLLEKFNQSLFKVNVKSSEVKT